MTSKYLSYWNKYYTRSGLTKRPSNFSRFCLEYGLMEEKPLLELGCGNGRDSTFFARKGIQVYGCDFTDQIKNLISTNLLTNLTYLLLDVTELNSLNDEFPEFGTIYSRFLLECLTEQESHELLDWSFRNLSDGGLLCLEARSIHDKSYGKGEKVPDESDAFIQSNHYRRFMRKEKLIKQLEDIGFNIVYYNEEDNLSVFRNKNPVLIRIIAQRSY